MARISKNQLQNLQPRFSKNYASGATGIPSSIVVQINDLLDLG
jgi:hypothetical protein